MGKREKIAVGILVIVACVNLFISLKNFYFSHTVIVPAYGGVYSEGMLGQPNYINPLLAHSESDTSLTRLVFSGLYKYDQQGRLTPDLADGMPEISEDQKQYTVNLKRGVKWHNDKPFTADDVVFTVLTLQDPAYKSPLKPIWSSTSVEKTGEYQVKFTTKDISGPFAHNLTLPILPRSVWGRVEPQNFLLAPANLQAVGTGPYVIREIKKLASGKIEQVRLDSYSNFYGGKPKIDSIVIKFYDNDQGLINALHSREINGLGYVALDRNIFVDRGRQELQTINLPLPHYQVVFFNLQNKVLANVNVRRALLKATDRQNIVTEVFKNDAVLPASPFTMEHNGTEADYNLAEAQTILDDAGWIIDPNTNVRSNKGTELELTITTNDFILNSKAAERLATQWKMLNIQVNLTVLPTKQLNESVIRSRDFDVLLFPQKLDADPDPFAFWHSSQVKDPGLNLTGFSNPQADRLITEARTTTNPEMREQKYRELDNLMNDQVPAIFLNQMLYIYALDANIKNIGLQTIYNPSGKFYNTPSWYIEQERAWK